MLQTTTGNRSGAWRRCTIVTVLIACVILLSACSDRPDLAYKELMDDDPQVRADAVVRLGQARAGDAVDSLVVLLDDPDEVVRVSAIRALAHIGNPRVVPDLVKFGDDPLKSVRLQVCQALGTLNSPDGIDTLEKMLYDPDDGIRLTAARNLGFIDHPRALEVLIKTSLYDENEIVRQHVVKVIGRRKAVEAIPIIESALITESDMVRSNSAHVLGMLGDVSSVPTLIEALEDPFHKVRSLSAHSLVAIAPDDPDVAAALAARIEVEEHDMVRADLAWNLVLAGKTEYRAHLRELLFKGGPEDVRAEAAHALGEVGERSDIKLLEKALDDKKGLVRKEAMKALDKLKEA
ncbi:MAG: HEAT repeat domain-containing protein [Acidobacteria bacterium]|uniref:HEAT repeat domain-containing protein n=1 Tax=Candidatus Polarisedimenticola svalbardensis TaxID=2886004 RepID=A0A8J7CFB0_9BACT|nr:HEAT repeat domain-containing protein [Candidatus Polarisedimenticola svalbardensis]